MHLDALVNEEYSRRGEMTRYPCFLPVTRAINLPGVWCKRDNFVFVLSLISICAWGLGPWDTHIRINRKQILVKTSV